MVNISLENALDMVPEDIKNNNFFLEEWESFISFLDMGDELYYFDHNEWPDQKTRKGFAILRSGFPMKTYVISITEG